MQIKTRSFCSEGLMHTREFQEFNLVVFGRLGADARVPFTAVQQDPFTYGPMRVDVFNVTCGDQTAYVTITEHEGNAPVVYVSDEHLALFNTDSYAKTHARKRLYVGDKYYHSVIQAMTTFNYKKGWDSL